MGSNLIASFALLVVATCAMVQFVLGQDQAMPNLKGKSISPMIPTESDVEMCKSKAAEDGETYKMTKKVWRETCRPQCLYENGGTSRVIAVDGQPCCDIGGAMATGTCKNGKCVPYFFGRK